ncbi:unnamed protein product [Brassica oleracea var. botrytis]
MIDDWFTTTLLLLVNTLIRCLKLSIVGSSQAIRITKNL